MSRSKIIVRNLTLAAVILFAANCKKNEPDPSNPGEKSGYVVGVLQITDQGEGTYLTTAASLDTGTISTTGRGTELPDYALFSRAGNNYVGHMLWSDGGVTNTYKIENGTPVKIQEALLDVDGRVRAITNDNTALYISHWGELGPANRYEAWRINEQGEVANHEVLPSYHHPDNTYGSSPQGAIVVGNKLYVLSTAIYWDDNVWIADRGAVDLMVYSYPAMDSIGSSRDTRVGGNLSSGSYSPVMINDEAGNIYTISCASKVAGFELPSTSGILKINNGATEFDPAYFFDVESLGYKIFNGIYAGNGKIVGTVLSVADDATGEQFEWYGIQTFRTAVLDVNTKSLIIVNAIPGHSLSETTPYLVEDGKVYVGTINDAEGGYIYKVDPATATATRGAKFEGIGIPLYIDKY